jgi:hypothetical protein
VVPANGVIKFTLGSVNGATVPALALHANQKVGASTSRSTKGAN